MVASNVYFIIAGEVRVLIRTPAGKEIILAEMRAGEFFGELSAIDAVERSANVTALTTTAVNVAINNRLKISSRRIACPQNTVHDVKYPTAEAGGLSPWRLSYRRVCHSRFRAEMHGIATAKGEYRCESGATTDDSSL